ncbi:MAG: zinc ribbon domain-containing protein [Planctomycetes bacterium]|nr:zinc ribbon domain-containing protein [Planctomycetota bacterium]
MDTLRGESGGLVANANGARRAMVLVCLLLATWIAMILVGSFIGMVTLEYTNFVHGHGPFDATGTNRDVAVHFVSGWWDAICSLARTYSFEFSARSETWIVWLATICALVGCVSLSAPLVGLRARAESGVPLSWAIAGGGVLGGSLGVGVVLVLIDLPRIAAWEAGHSLTGGMVFVTSLIAWIGTGVIWSWALQNAGKGPNPNRIGRFVRWLFAGTCVELAIAAPTFAVAARRDSCFCGWMSWWSILIGTVTLTVLGGPMLLLMLTRRARLGWIRRACGNCGYPVRTGAHMCPECGAGIRGNAPASLPA